MSFCTGRRQPKVVPVVETFVQLEQIAIGDDETLYVIAINFISSADLANISIDTFQ